MSEQALRSQLNAAADNLVGSQVSADPEYLGRAASERQRKRTRRAAFVGTAASATVVACVIGVALTGSSGKPRNAAPAATSGTEPQLGTIPLTAEAAQQLSVGHEAELLAAGKSASTITNYQAGDEAWLLGQTAKLTAVAVPDIDGTYCVDAYVTATPSSQASECNVKLGSAVANGSISIISRAWGVDPDYSFILGAAPAGAQQVRFTGAGVSAVTVATTDGGSGLAGNRFFLTAWPKDSAATITTIDSGGETLATRTTSASGT